MAEVAEREGNAAGRRRALERAGELFEQHGATGHLGRVRERLAAIA